MAEKRKAENVNIIFEETNHSTKGSELNTAAKCWLISHKDLICLGLAPFIIKSTVSITK